MKRYITGLAMSFGMFCAIPLPSHPWDDDCMGLVLPFMPVVGLLMGVLWWGLASLLALSAMHPVLAAAILAAAPMLLSGFLHLDGYMDTCDALLSRRSLEDMLRILKDPHTGAFAVIALALLVLLQFAAVYAIVDRGRAYAAFAIIPVIARCCASLSLLLLGPMPQSGYANMFKAHAKGAHKAFVLGCALATTTAAYLWMGLPGLAAALATALGFAAAMAYAYRAFDGASGDLAGFALVIGELCGLLAWGAIA